MAEEQGRDTMSAAHSFARACLADGPEQRHGPREALLASVSATLSSVAGWRRESGGSDHSSELRMDSCQQVAESAKEMLEFDGEAVMPAYQAFLNTAAEVEESLAPSGDRHTPGEEVAGSAAGGAAGGAAAAVAAADDKPLAPVSRGVRGSCHPDLYRRQLELVSTLASLSLSLRNVAVEERNQALSKELERINLELYAPATSAVAWLEQMHGGLGHDRTVSHEASGTESTTGEAPQPVIFPLDRVSSTATPRRILRIVPETARVLKSRERTPLLLHVEIFTENVLPGQRARSDEITAGSSEPEDGTTSVVTSTGGSRAREQPEADTEPASEVQGEAEGTTRATTSAVSPSPSPAKPKEAGSDQEHRCYGVQFTAPSLESDSPRPRLELQPEPEPEPEPERMRTMFESVLDIENRLREASPYGHLPTWGIGCLIVKSGDDIRQEQLAMQLIAEFDQIFSGAGLALWLRPYRVLATDPNSGMIELVPSVMSIHALKDRYVCSRFCCLIPYSSPIIGIHPTLLFSPCRR